MGGGKEGQVKLDRDQGHTSTSGSTSVIAAVFHVYICMYHERFVRSGGDVVRGRLGRAPIIYPSAGPQPQLSTLSQLCWWETSRRWAGVGVLCTIRAGVHVPKAHSLLSFVMLDTLDESHTILLEKHCSY